MEKAAPERIASGTYQTLVFGVVGATKSEVVAFGKLDTREAPRRSKVSRTHLLHALIRCRRLSARLPSAGILCRLHNHGCGRGSWQFRKRISARVSSLNLIPESAPAHFAVSQKLVPRLSTPWLRCGKRRWRQRRSMVTCGSMCRLYWTDMQQMTVELASSHRLAFLV